MTRNRRPLDGIVVIDFTQALAGPVATSIMADYGATVIKVENTKGSEMSRHVGLHKALSADPLIGGDSFWAINRNKNGISVDTRNPEGMDIVYKLLEKADVIVSNYRPGTTKAMGIDYDSLKERYPRLICAEIGAFAEKAREREPAFDAIIQAASGVLECTGEPERPSKVGFSITDVTSGLFLVQGIMFALYDREKTGRGQNVEVRMQDAAMFFFQQEVVDLLNVPDYRDFRYGSRSNISCPNGGAKTKDGFIIINPANDKLWKVFCTEVIDRPEWLTDPRYDNSLHRLENNEQLWVDIEEIFSQWTTEEIFERMKAANLPASPIESSKNAFLKAQAEGRHIVAEIEHPLFGKLGACGYVVDMSETPAFVDKGAPILGQDTDDVLKRLGGYSEQEIADLKQRGVIRNYRDEIDLVSIQH